MGGAHKRFRNIVKTVSRFQYIAALVIGSNNAVIVRKAVCVGIEPLLTVVKRIVDDAVICKITDIIVFQCLCKHFILRAVIDICRHARKAYGEYGHEHQSREKNAQCFFQFHKKQLLFLCLMPNKEKYLFTVIINLFPVKCNTVVCFFSYYS